MKSFSLQIVTPDGQEYKGNVSRIILRTMVGELAVMAGHIDIVTALGMGVCRIDFLDGTHRNAACMGGFLTVSDNQVKVVATTFEWSDKIDVARAQKAREAAEAKLSNSKDMDDVNLARAKLSRALVRIGAANRT